MHLIIVNNFNSVCMIEFQFVAVEGFITNVVDSFPKRFNTAKSRMILVGVYCIVSFLLGLCMVSRVSYIIFIISIFKT